MQKETKLTVTRHFGTAGNETLLLYMGATNICNQRSAVRCTSYSHMYMCCLSFHDVFVIFRGHILVPTRLRYFKKSYQHWHLWPLFRVSLLRVSWVSQSCVLFKTIIWAYSIMCDGQKTVGIRKAGNFGWIGFRWMPLVSSLSSLSSILRYLH